LHYADGVLDLLHRRVRRGDLESELSAREMDLLAYLLCHPEEVLTKERILKDVWGDDAEPDGNVLHVYANYLRNKIERGLYPRIIHTVRGVGYILSERDPEEKPPPNLPW
ncbi:MAG: winged helix-turn-helix transcriptional regulator, partial [Planctomycetes bacterium]|nr:winged helix-turn-helix transcriptional regulator [Planctomycetota bacterium]